MSWSNQLSAKNRKFRFSSRARLLLHLQDVGSSQLLPLFYRIFWTPFQELPILNGSEKLLLADGRVPGTRRLFWSSTQPYSYSFSPSPIDHPCTSCGPCPHSFEIGRLAKFSRSKSFSSKERKSHLDRGGLFRSCPSL